VGAGGAVLGAAGEAPAGDRLWVDTHTHFYNPHRPGGVPWPPGDDPLLYRQVRPPEYRQLTAGQGVVGTVVVEASPWVEDNAWLLELAERDPFIMGVVGCLRPGEPGFRTHLARFARHPQFRGIRVGSWGERPDLADARVVDDLDRLAARGLSLDLNLGADTLPAIARLAERLPRLQIVVNHLANVRIDGRRPPVEWMAGMRALAPHRNVACKISGLVEGSGGVDGRAPVDLSFYRPVLDVAWGTFGGDRLMFGSNWPVSARFASFRTVRSIVADFLADKAPRDRERVMGGNARRVYRVPHLRRGTIRRRCAALGGWASARSA
jgi:L-fuconolactonase